MTACTHTIGDQPNGLRCQLDEHPDHPNGHCYQSGSGSELDDRHGEQGHG
jgi:hypothetical protein